MNRDERFILNMRFLGQRLNKNVYNRYGALFLPAYTLLRTEQLMRLTDQGIVLHESDVERAGDDAADWLIDETLAELRGMFALAQKRGKIPENIFYKEVVPRVQRLVRTKNVASLFTGLFRKDQYTYRHSLAVGILSTMLGQWLHLDERELDVLTEAALLHDIGKIRVSSDILNKPDKLTKEEFDEIKRHTLYGFELIARTGRHFDRHAVVALEHHERMDGSGYPHGKSAAQTDRLSQIVAVVDVFHAMCSSRVYKEAKPWYDVIREMEEGAYGLFEPVIIQVFIRRVMEMLIGCEVVLTDGDTARIVQIHPHAPAKPLVYCRGHFIDLSTQPELRIEKVTILLS